MILGLKGFHVIAVTCCADIKFCVLHLHICAVAKKSSMFDDPIMEIQELTSFIKDDITALNVAVSDLQTLQNIEIADGNYSEDRLVHSNTVCDDLKNKLMGATKQFQDVLTTRTEVSAEWNDECSLFCLSVLLGLLLLSYRISMILYTLLFFTEYQGS